MASVNASNFLISDPVLRSQVLCNGVNSAFSEPHKTVYESDSFRNANRTNQFVNDYSKCSYLIPIEQRESTNWQTVDRNLTTITNQRPQMRPFDKSKMTLRQTYQSRRFGDAGTKQSEVGGYIVAKPHARQTQKETTLIEDYNGIGTKNVKNPLDRCNYLNATGQDLKTSTLTPYTPGPMKQYAAQGSCDVNMSSTHQLSSIPNRRVQWKSNLPQSIQNKEKLGYLSTIKLNAQQKNIYYDPTILTQLKNNPFVITVNPIASCPPYY